MNTVFLIARDSVRATLHHRVLLAVMLVVVIITLLFSLVLSTQLEALSGQAATPPPAAAPGSPQADGGPQGGSGDAQTGQSLQDMQRVRSEALQGFNGFLVFGGSLLAIFMGATAVSGDIRRGSIAMILARPVTRGQYLAGKLAGIAVVLLGYTVLASAALAAFIFTHQLEAVPAVRYAPWLMFCQSLMYASAAFALSMLMHPTLAGVLTFFVRAGWFSQFFSPPNPLYYLYFVLPSYAPFDVTGQFRTGDLVRAGDVGMLTLYAVNVAAVLLLIAMWRFRAREIA